MVVAIYMYGKGGGTSAARNHDLAKATATRTPAVCQKSTHGGNLLVLWCAPDET